MKWLTDRAVRSERVRLAEMLGPAAIRADLAGDPPIKARSIDPVVPPAGALPKDDDADARGNGDRQGGQQHQRRSAPTTELADRFAPVLIEYYAYGLVRAKRHDATSLIMSTLGGAVVVAGAVALAFFARTNQAVAASGLATVAGILTNAIASLFHRQASQALRHMETQTLALRDDMRRETDSQMALSQLTQIANATYRDQLRAAVVLRLSGATLPPGPAADDAARGPSAPGSSNSARPPTSAPDHSL